MTNVTQVQDILNNKGIFSMTTFENVLIKLECSQKKK
jgi:hypothetical protein